MINRVLGFLSIFCVAGALAVVALPASAQECVSDQDCPANYACEVVGEMGCLYACAPGEECAPPAGCASQEIRGCVPQPCTSDEQCEDGMVCFSETRELCTRPTEPYCPPGSDCPMPAPPECEILTESACVPRHTAPCQQDADCGEGFSCVEAKECWCEGSVPAQAGGATPADEDRADEDRADSSAAEPESGGGEDDPAPVLEGDMPVPSEEQCGCEPSGEYYCDPQQIECVSEADCPQGWTCEAGPSQAVSCSVPEGDTGECVPEPVEVSSICLPPYSDLGGIGRGWNAESTVGEVTLADGIPNNEPRLDGDDADEGGADTGLTDPSSTEEDGADTGANDLSSKGESAPGEDEAASSGDDGGCRVANVGADAAGSTLAWLVGLASLLVLRRRRRG